MNGREHIASNHGDDQTACTLPQILSRNRVHARGSKVHRDFPSNALGYSRWVEECDVPANTAACAHYCHERTAASYSQFVCRPLNTVAVRVGIEDFVVHDCIDHDRCHRGREDRCGEKRVETLSQRNVYCPRVAGGTYARSPTSYLVEHTHAILSPARADRNRTAEAESAVFRGRACRSLKKYG